MQEADLLPLVQQRTQSTLMDEEQVQVTVELDRINYFVGPASKPVQILHDVSLKFEPGEFVCVMGPSGCGKTTTMSVVRGNAAGRVEGTILVNGVPGPTPDFKSISKLIPQEDVLLDSLTVRETFYYQSELVMPEALTRDEKDVCIQRVVDALNLESCLDVKIGSVDERGISGGQRKRVSIGMDLLSNPACLFVDEPTSGLDSKTAEDVVQGLRDLAHGTGDSGHSRTIISTIHQPSYRIFSKFDKVVLLTRGRVAFQGSHDELEALFDRLDLSTPLKENPADHYMRVLQDEELSERVVAEFQRMRKAERFARLSDDGASGASTESDTGGSSSTYDAEAAQNSGCWGRRPRWCCNTGPSSAGSDGGLLEPLAGGLESGPMSTMQRNQKLMSNIPTYPTSKRKQFWTLFKRSTYDTVKDPNKLLRTFVLKAMVGVLIGVVWWHAANPPKLQKLFPIEGAMFCILMNSCIDTLAMTIIVFPTQRSLLIREYKNGSYSLLAFYPALMSSMTLMSVLYAFTMTVPIYLMVELQLTSAKFFYFIAVVVLMTCIGNALGVIVGATSKDLIEAQNKLMPTLAPLVLFSGYVIPYKDMQAPFRVFYELSFFQMGLSAMQLNQLTGLTFDLSILNIDVPVEGEIILREFFNLDPDQHGVADYVLRLLVYALVITFGGYWIIKRDLSRKTG